jgi:uncharacterized protein with PIN domain
MVPLDLDVKMATLPLLSGLRSRSARATGEPLLFTGDDFARTDITPALGEQLEPPAL